MITIRTKNPVTLEDAFNFEKEQGDKRIKKQNILHLDPCIWELRVGFYSLSGSSFSAPVVWFQKQPYSTGNSDTPIATKDVLMFRENFTLPMADVQTLWEAINGQILTTDNLVEKMEEFVEAGIIHWVGNIRQVFGLDETGFEIIK